MGIFDVQLPVKLDAAAQVKVAELDRRDGVGVHAEHILRLQVSVSNSYQEWQIMNSVCLWSEPVFSAKARPCSGPKIYFKMSATTHFSLLQHFICHPLYRNLEKPFKTSTV